MSLHIRATDYMALLPKEPCKDTASFWSPPLCTGHAGGRDRTRKWLHIHLYTYMYIHISQSLHTSQSFTHHSHSHIKVIVYHMHSHMHSQSHITVIHHITQSLTQCVTQSLCTQSPARPKLCDKSFVNKHINLRKYTHIYIHMYIEYIHM